MAEELPIEQIDIQISADASKAIDGITKLITALGKIQKSVGSAEGGLKTVTSAIDKLASAVDKIDNGSISKIERLGEGIKNLASIKSLGQSKAAQQLAGIGQAAQNLGGSSAEQLKDVSRTIDDLNGTVGSKSNGAANAAANAGDKIKDATDKVGKGAKDAKNATESAFDKIGKSFKNLTTMFSRRVLYRAFNKIISTITSSFKTGLDAVYQYSKSFTGSFSEAMDTIATSTHYITASLGAMASPLIEAVAPAVDWLADKFVGLLNIVNQIFARLAGKDTWTRAIKKQVEYADATDDATKANKRFKASILGIDEINPLQDNTPTASGSGSSKNDLGSYEFVEEALNKSKVDEWLKTIEGIVVGIGAAFAAWKLSEKFMKDLDVVRSLKSQSFQFEFGIIGAVDLIDTLKRLKGYIDDISKNGANFQNVTGTIGSGIRALGDALMIFGNAKIGGAITTFGSAVNLISDISNIAVNGANLDNISAAVKDIGGILIGIGAWTGNVSLAGIGLILDGVGGVINQFKNVWDAIRTGDWSGVDKGALVLSAIEVVGGIAVALGTFSKLKGLFSKKDVEKTLTEVTDTTSTLTKSLGKLAKNLAIGIGIMAEILVAVGLFEAGIWGIGWGLDKINEAWQPVLKNGKDVAKAIGIGTGILVGVGVAAGLLGVAATGTAGAVPAAIGLGAAMLLELNVTTVIFCDAIIETGDELAAIGDAWEPVLNNGGDIAKSIGIGTGVLIGVGAVAAALGVAKIATGLFLPAAIKSGTKLLNELSEAFVSLCDSLTDTADKLVDLSEPLANLNGVLPGLKTNMKVFTGFMAGFAGEVVAITASDLISGIAGTINKVITFFVGDPIKNLTKDVTKNYNQAKDLNNALDKAVPELKKAKGGFEDYLNALNALSGKANNSTFGGFTLGNFKDSLISTFRNIINGLIKGLNKVIAVPFNGINTILDKIRDVGIGPLKPFSWIKNVSVPQIPEIKAFAEGGFPDSGEMFMARESGPELVGRIGSKTAVASNDQIIAGISEGVADANAEQNALLREEISILRKILDKNVNYSNYGGARSIISDLERKNRRDGKTIIPVGV